MNSPSSARVAAAIHRRYGESVRIPDDLAGADALAAMNERAVCRRYRAEPVPEALLRMLFATALASPTKSDLQQASIVRVTGPADRAAIHALLPGSPWIAGAPEFLVFCGDGFRLRRIFERRGRAFPNEHLDAFFNATVDGAIVLSTFVQAAGLAGLGSCPISEIRNHAQAISELLALPDWVFPIAGLTLGWPEAYEPFSPRLALTATVHEGRYDAGRIEQELDAYDGRRIRDRPYRKQRLADRFGTAERYGWTEDKARQYSEVQRGDFGAFVRRKRYRLE
ncbi:MAG TPA: nitroreductase family protein [Burkholderiales bacterium]|nr:nitroreductase family protein [Burkholderiales bacterium]